MYYLLFFFSILIWGCKDHSSDLTSSKIDQVSNPTRKIASIEPYIRKFKLEWEDNFSDLNEQQKQDPCYNFDLHKPQCEYQNKIGDCKGNLINLIGLNTCIWRVMSFYNFWNTNFKDVDFSPYTSPGQTFNQKNIEIKDGKLILFASINPDFKKNFRKCGPDSPNDFSDTGVNCPYSSGGISSKSAVDVGLNGFDKTGGRYEARIRYSIFNGPNAKSLYCSPQISTWPTFWFLPVWGTGTGLYHNKGWPLNGEIDVIDYIYSPDWNTGKTPSEHLLLSGLISGDANGEEKAVDKSIGIGVPDIFKPNQKINCQNLPQVGPWHNYALEWKANEFVRIYKDEVLILNVIQGEMIKAHDGEIRPIQIPVGSMHTLLELSLPSWANADNVVGKKNRMEVDYIKYSRFCNSDDTDCYTPAKDLLIKRCPNKGFPSGVENCQVFGLKTPKLKLNINYWIDINPKWPGVYYKQTNGKCSQGGQLSADNNCQLDWLPQLNQKEKYYLKKTYPNPGVYYKATQKKCASGGVPKLDEDACLVKEISQGEDPVLFEGVSYSLKNVKSGLKPNIGSNSTALAPWSIYYPDTNMKCIYGGSFVTTGICQLMTLNSESMDEQMEYWIDTNPLWPGVYYLPNF